MGKRTVTFYKFCDLSTRRRHATEYGFQFKVVDSSLLGAPEEKSETRDYFIRVGITETLADSWRLSDTDLVKVLFEYGKRHVIQKIKDGTLAEREELWLSTTSHPAICPFDPSRIEVKNGVPFEVEIPEKPLMQNQNEIKLASSIIDARDNVNAIFKQKNKENLLLLDQERNLLEFFRPANSKEEFSYRVTALGNIVGNLNVKVMKKITKIHDSKSISLLDAHLKNLTGKEEGLIKVFKNLNRIRQSYPVHGDHVEGVLETHSFFKLKYPVENFDEAWKVLLMNYLSALKDLLLILGNY